MLQAIIFDLDGVLVDSPKYIWESFNALLKDKVTFSKDDARRYLASSLREAAKSWEERFGIAIGDIKDFSKRAGEIQFQLMEKDFQPNQALHRLLEEARQEDIKMAVGTSSHKWRAERMLKLFLLEHYFPVVITAEDVTRHKPHPDVFLTAAKKLKVDPSRCVVIEDAVQGIAAARNGGMKAVGLITSYHSADELQEADIIIDSFSQITVGRLAELWESS